MPGDSPEGAGSEGEGSPRLRAVRAVAHAEADARLLPGDRQPRGLQVHLRVAEEGGRVHVGVGLPHLGRAHVQQRAGVQREGLADLRGRGGDAQGDSRRAGADVPGAPVPEAHVRVRAGPVRGAGLAPEEEADGGDVRQEERRGRGAEGVDARRGAVRELHQLPRAQPQAAVPRRTDARQRQRGPRGRADRGGGQKRVWRAHRDLLAA